MVEFKKLKLGYIAFAKLKKRPKEKRWQKLDSNLLRIVKSDEKYVITVYWDTNNNYMYGVKLEDEFYLTKKEFFKMVKNGYFEFEHYSRR